MPATASFWEFSLRTYAGPKVADACLKLQDDYGVDVNLLLYCCWLGTRRRALEPELLERALEFSRPWADNVVAPLRHARRWLKSHDSAPLTTQTVTLLRDRFKVLELAGERLQQHALEALSAESDGDSAAGGSDLTATLGNVRGYLEAAGIRADTAALEHLAVVVTASRDDGSAASLLPALRAALAVAE
jgi:uncharacterized protein (TIGR02444 family)